MHDCPACRVPLHGYEEVCPSCGTRQQVRRSRSVPFGTDKVQQPGVNWMPIILSIIGFIIVIGAVASQTWLGQLMREGPRAEDPMSKLTYLDARTIIENELNKNIQAVGATGTLTWKQSGSETPPSAQDKFADKAVEMTVDVKLSNPELRKQIVNPIKPYMEKAKLYTMTVNDKTSGKTWTYNVSPATSVPDADEAPPVE